VAILVLGVWIKERQERSKSEAPPAEAPPTSLPKETPGE
jgi:hypothetical protein